MNERKVNRDSINKRFELKIKRIINDIIIRGKYPEMIDKPANIFTAENCKKILILRQDRIGDALVTIPFIRILKDKLPDSIIDVILSDKNKGISPALDPYVDNIHLHKKDIQSNLRLKKKLRREHYDLVIDPFDNVSTTSTLLVQFSKASNKLGIDKDNRRIYDYTVPLLDKNSYHIVDRIAQLLLPFGIYPSKVNKKMEYKLSGDEIIKAQKAMGKKTKPIRMGIVLTGSSDAKFWGIRNNVKFIKETAELRNNIEFMLFSTQDNGEKLEIIEEKTPAGIAPFVDSVHEYAALLSTCDIILTPDTSAVHFAACFGIPAIVLYKVVPGHSGGAPWTPYGTPFRAIKTEEDTLKEIHYSIVVKEFLDFYQELGLESKT